VDVADDDWAVAEGQDVDVVVTDPDDADGAGRGSPRRKIEVAADAEADQGGQVRTDSDLVRVDMGEQPAAFLGSEAGPRYCGTTDLPRQVLRQGLIGPRDSPRSPSMACSASRTGGSRCTRWSRRPSLTSGLRRAASRLRHEGDHCAAVVPEQPIVEVADVLPAQPVNGIVIEPADHVATQIADNLITFEPTDHVTARPIDRVHAHRLCPTTDAAGVR